MEEVLNKEQLYIPSEAKRDNDFIGFGFGGIHSSTFGIVRTSDGSRFNENLLPTTQDKTVQVPGGDGTYYFGSYFTQKQFNISIAFDSLTDSNLRKLKQWLGDKKIKELIFDEAPYKVYRAKVTGSATIKHICFLENNERVYKGEGTIQFTCYEPFAKSRKESGAKTKEFYSLERYPTRDEWIETSGILTQAEMAAIDIFNGNSAKIYNPGDLECDFSLTMSFNGGYIPERILWVENKTNKSLSLGSINKKGADAAVKVDSKSNLLVGVDSSGNLTGNTYNEYIKSGHFFKIPLCGKNELTFNIDGGSTGCKLEYRWVYF